MLMSHPPDSCQNPSSYSNGCRSFAAAYSDGLKKNANPASPGQGALEEGRRKRKEGEKKRESGKEKKERGLEAGARAFSQSADMVRAGRTGDHGVVPNRPQGTKEERAVQCQHHALTEKL